MSALVPIPLENSRAERPLGRLDKFALDSLEDQTIHEFIHYFMEEYAGHPYTPKHLPELTRNGHNYDRVRISSISESGTLIHVRETLENVAASDRYRVITADITEQTIIDDWRVSDVRYQRDYLERIIQTDIILARSTVDVHQGAVDLPSDFDDPVVERRWRQYESEQKKADARQARVMLGHERFAFKAFDSQPESLTPLVEFENTFVYELPKLRQVQHRLGRVAFGIPTELKHGVA